MSYRRAALAALSLLLLIAAGTACTAAVPQAAMTYDSKLKNAAISEPTPAFIKSSQSVEGMEKIAENETLMLFFSSETTEIAVIDKSSGNVWYSNPPNREDDAKASGVIKDQLSSQLSVVFYNADGQQYTMNNYSDSVKNSQFEVEKLENGIRIVYKFGDISLGIDAIPLHITKERLDSFLANMDEKTQKYVLAKFKFDKDTEIYQRWDTTLKGVHLKRTVEALTSAGYTEADLEIDNEGGSGEGSAKKEKPKFTVPMEYRLEGTRLVATVPMKEVEYSQSFPLHKIHVLDFFGAADTTQSGYIFVPDGSGSLINLNNGKIAQEPFSQPVYGTDNTVAERENVQRSEPTRLPVFGLKQGDAAFLAVIEDGEAIANVNADISGRLNSYNYVYSSFTTVSKDELRMYGGWSGENVINIFPSDIYRGNITLTYSFLSGKDADYSGMAKQYRSYLAAMYGLSPLKQGTPVPFYLDILGNIPKRTSFLGIPYNTMVPLTTFKQAEQIADELQQGDVKNIQMRYTGWFNKGINHKPPTSVSVDGKLGGKKGLQTFAEHMKGKGIQLYPDVSFLRVYQNTLSFWPSSQAARLVSRKVAKVYPYDPATYYWDTQTKSPQYLLSARELPGFVQGFSKGYEKLGIEGLSLRDFGDEVNSDYRVGSIIDRQMSSNVIAEQTRQLKEQFSSLLVVGGNANAAGYADHILMAPELDSRFGITDTPVPFFQLVFHGYIQYAGKPINMNEEQDPKKNLLHVLENGSGVYFQWMFADPASVKDTEFTQLYSVYYKNWIGSALELYKTVNETLGDTYALTIDKHERLADGVFRTTYSNGKSVIVNYTDKDVTVGGITVKAVHFATGGE